MLPSLRPAFALWLLPLLACESAELAFDPTEPQAVTGIWTGPITAGITDFAPTAVFDEIELVLTEDADGRIAGAAAFFQRRAALTGTAGRISARAFEVDGANAFPVVALTFRSGFLLSTSELVYMRARFVAGDRLEGELFGAGFDQHRVRLRRAETTTVTLN